MTRYHIKEIFLTLQGEGMNAGRAAVFVRFAGCNLWSGREKDRARGPGSCSAWCDTDFVGGVQMTPAEIAARMTALWPASGRPFVVLTGGEPALQLDDDELLTALHDRRAQVAIETNGTRALPPGFDWVTVSPKAGAPLFVKDGAAARLESECKVVWPQALDLDALYAKTIFDRYTLSPLDGPNYADNLKLATEYCLRNPRWRLTVQLHKLVGLP